MVSLLSTCVRDASSLLRLASEEARITLARESAPGIACRLRVSGLSRGWRVQSMVEAARRFVRLGHYSPASGGAASFDEPLVRMVQHKIG